MKVSVFGAVLVLPAALFAQGTVSLPGVTVHSPRIANQSPAGTFAMPVSALRYEPRVDIHGRNMAEGQADVTIRGGVFENTGFQLGALTVFDPQTGHYLAEIPVAPAMLSAPEVITGADLSLSATNSTSGAVAQRWRAIRTTGVASAAIGDFGLRRAELYQGYITPPNIAGRRFGVDVAFAQSKGDGSVPFGEHAFGRANVRFQTATAASQTDLFAGYQGKRFGWPNLYTPFNSNETENLQTTLFSVNHRVDGAAGDYVEAGAYHRRNKDDYAFNRFAPIGSVHPFQHTTWVSGAALNARRDLGAVALNLRGELLADEIQSTSLTFGPYRKRTFTRLAIVPEKAWARPDGGKVVAKAGLAYDDTNRDSGAVSPMVELAREFPASAVRRLYLSYAKTTQVATYTALKSSAAAGLFRGNPDLGRQRAHTVEIGGSGSIGGWTAESAIFWRRDDALVDWTFRRGVTARTANAVDIDVGGFELVARRSWSGCDVVIGYTGLTKDADYRGASVDASFYALNYARHRLTAAFTVRLSQEFTVRIDNVARIQADNLLRVAGGDDALSTAASVAYRPKQWRGVEVALHLDNAWDEDFQDVPAVPASRRQFSAGVSYAW